MKKTPEKNVEKGPALRYALMAACMISGFVVLALALWLTREIRDFTRPLPVSATLVSKESLDPELSLIPATHAAALPDSQRPKPLHAALGLFHNLLAHAGGPFEFSRREFAGVDSVSLKLGRPNTMRLSSGSERAMTWPPGSAARGDSVFAKLFARPPKIPSVAGNDDSASGIYPEISVSIPQVESTMRFASTLRRAQALPDSECARIWRAYLDSTADRSTYSLAALNLAIVLDSIACKSQNPAQIEEVIRWYDRNRNVLRPLMGPERLEARLFVLQNHLRRTRLNEQ